MHMYTGESPIGFIKTFLSSFVLIFRAAATTLIVLPQPSLIPLDLFELHNVEARNWICKH